jgi:lipopolysaccharide biosynthesis glycosyltransferase
MENAAPENTYRIYIFHSGISAAVLDKLSSQSAQFPHFSIEGIDISSRVKQYHFFTANRSDLTQEAYYRLFIPELLSDYEKVIYLDGDMICRSDISKLYAFDLGDNLIGAARDIAGISWFNFSGQCNDKTRFDFKSNCQTVTDYYNSGLLVINNRQFQKTISTAQLIELALSRKWNFNDQDVLNFLTHGRTYFLPYSWNFIHDPNTNYIPESLVKEYTEAEGHEDIIHFAGPVKPWLKPVFVDYAYIPYFMLFWKYAVETPFIDTITRRMKESHLLGGSYEPFVLDQIRHRNGGFRFIFNCLMARIKQLPKEST